MYPLNKTQFLRLVEILVKPVMYFVLTIINVHVFGSGVEHASPRHAASLITVTHSGEDSSKFTTCCTGVSVTTHDQRAAAAACCSCRDTAGVRSLIIAGRRLPALCKAVAVKLQLNRIKSILIRT